MQTVSVSFIIFSLVSIISTASSGSETALGNFLAEKLSKSDVVFLGEWHSINGHRESSLEALPRLIEDHLVNSIALEIVDHEQTKLFQQYVDDDFATPGSDREKEYLLCFSSSERSLSVLGKCELGGWPSVVSRPSIELIQYLRVQSRLKHVRVCGIDYDDNYNNTGRTSLNEFARLPEAYQSYVSNVYGYSPDHLNSGVVRELYIARNISECIVPKQKTLILTGAFHASKSVSSGMHAYSIVKYFNPSISLYSGIQISPPNDDSWAKIYNGPQAIDWHREAPYMNPEFLNRNRTNERWAADTKKLDPHLRTDLGKVADDYDFVIFGPASDTNGQ